MANDPTTHPNVPQASDRQARTTKELQEKRSDQIGKDEDDRRARQKANNAKAAEVMEKSKPTPTQEENDRAKLGTMHPDEREVPDNPEMPPLEEQRKAK